MAKKSRKLALKKETLRALDQAQLEQVAGGTLYNGGYFVGGGIDWYVYRSIGGVSVLLNCTTTG